MERQVSLTERLERAWQAWNNALAGLSDADFELQVYRQWNVSQPRGFAAVEVRVRRRAR